MGVKKVPIASDLINKGVTEEAISGFAVISRKTFFPPGLDLRGFQCSTAPRRNDLLRARQSIDSIVRT